MRGFSDNLQKMRLEFHDFLVENHVVLYRCCKNKHLEIHIVLKLDQEFHILFTEGVMEFLIKK